nr:DNA translocase FtsK [Ectobacillus funiculus]
MLDWMKKLLKKEESVPEAPQTDHSPVIDKYEPLQKEIEARVTYQYPKGKFRFPLDINEPLERREPVRTDQVKRQPSIEQDRSRPRPRSLQWEQPEQARPSVPQHVTEPTLQQPEEQVFTRPQLPESSRVPFRPTEVPSPVFGYTRPGQVEEKRPPVEDEDIVLSNERKSVVDAWLEKNGYVSVFEKTEAIHIEKAYGDTEEQTLLSKEYVEKAYEKPEVVQVVQNEALTELKTVGLPELEDFASEGEQQEQGPSEEAEAVKAVKASELLKEEEAKEQQEQESSEETEVASELLKEEEAKEQQEQESSEEAEAVETSELLEEEEAKEQQEQESSEEAEAVETSELLEEEEAKEQQEQESSEETEAVETSELLGEEEAKEQQGQETSKVVEAAEEKGPLENPQSVKVEGRERKRFVPYNVMMLKQDRLRLEQKKQEMPLYTLPPIHLLHVPSRLEVNDDEWLQEQMELLNTTFFNFNVGAKVVNLTQGPSVTRFEVQPDPGVKVNKITNLSDDIKLNLAARDIRIEAPIPGKNAVGIEVPNKESKPVFLREILRSPEFAKSDSPLTVALGLDISGAPIVTDIRKMPHGLIAGSTGSGKSVCINAILTSILYKAMPHEVKLMLIDPKMVELAPYNEVPHLVSPVITDAKAATAALKWAVEEMDRRYESFAHAGARDLTRYNDLVEQKQAPGQQLPYIVIVIDELADLMMVAAADVEEAICRIAQKARACGIHLLVATQRPSVDVITGLIKSNIPTRIAFTVSSQVDSRTIIDTAGAEKLLGRGDMLFLENGTSKTVRLQGVYVSDEEIERTVQHVKQQMKPCYMFQQDDLLAKAEQHAAEDELFYDACQFVLEQGGASASSVQRRFRIGYNRAARLIEEMEAQGIISEARGTKPRDVLITEGELAAMQDMNGQG